MRNELDRITKDEKAYKQFTNLVDSGEFNDAYRLFKKRPGLIGFMAPYEISCVYGGIKRYVGDEESDMFVLLTIRELGGVLENIPIIDVFCKTIEKELDDKLKKDLGEDYKKWLQRENDSI